MRSRDAEVDVLMATWNGSRFLKQQLDSLFRQTFQNFRLLVRDDDSSDGTLEIIERCRREFPDRVVVQKNRTREGARETFSILAQESTAPYVAFCDQDDIWRGDKLELSLAAATKAEAQRSPETPVLIFSDMELIGENQQRLAASMWSMKHVNPQRASLGTLLVQNIVTGCTVLANRSLLVLGLPIPGEAVMHDFWLALVASAFGVFHPLHETLVQYRQHDENAIGAGNGWGIGDGFRRLFADPQFKEGIGASRRQTGKFAERYENRLSAEQKGIVRAWLRSEALPAGIRQWTLYRSGLRRTSVLNNLAFLARV
jgi:glycosyltransferase involved in cell wall biosynthesis